LLDERNRVAAYLTAEAHKTGGTGENDQVGSVAVRVEWTPADVGGAGTTKLDAVALDDWPRVRARVRRTLRRVRRRRARRCGAVFAEGHLRAGERGGHLRRLRGGA